MVAAVLVALWVCVLTPMLLVEFFGRRRSSIAAFEATLRGLDRSTSGAFTFAGPSIAGYATGTANGKVGRERTVAQTRARRQQTVLGIGLFVVAVTLVGVVASFSRATLALHAFADQFVVVYAAGCVWTNAHGRGSRAERLPLAAQRANRTAQVDRPRRGVVVGPQQRVGAAIGEHH